MLMIRSYMFLEKIVLSARLTTALDKVSAWSSKNKLTINESKTKIMAFASAIRLKNLPKPKIKLNGEVLKAVGTYKYLGVILDEELKFSQHVKSVINSVRFKSNLLYRTCKMMPSEALIRVYKSHVLPGIDYCDILYVNSSITLLEELQRLQNKCLKTCLFKHLLTPTEIVHSEANLPTLHERRKYLCKLYAFKRAQTEKYVEKKLRVIRFSNAPSLAYSIIHCTAYEHSPLVTLAQCWNALSPDTRNIADIQEFKTQMKEVLGATIPVVNQI